MFLLCLNLQTNQFYMLDCMPHVSMILCACRYTGSKSINRDWCIVKEVDRPSILACVSWDKLQGYTCIKKKEESKGIRLGEDRIVSSHLALAHSKKNLQGKNVCEQTGKLNKAIIPLYNMLFPEFLKHLFLQRNVY